MKNEYAIISKTAIDETMAILEDELEKANGKDFKEQMYNAGYITGMIVQLKKIKNRSTPLIPEIEKAIKEGIEMRSESQIYGRTEKTIEKYISNLKLNI